MPAAAGGPEGLEPLGPPPSPLDEGRHGESLVERWTFTAGGDGLDRLLVVHLSLVPAHQRASYTAAVRTETTYAVVLVAADLPMPRRGLELRGPGIWADHNVEEPLERWSLGLEAFGVGIEIDQGDDLEVLLAASGSPHLRGDRSPLGWDLEWISRSAPRSDEGGYRVDCRVEGELFTEAGGRELDVAGERSHHW